MFGSKHIVFVTGGISMILQIVIFVCQEKWCLSSGRDISYVGFPTTVDNKRERTCVKHNPITFLFYFILFRCRTTHPLEKILSLFFSFTFTHFTSSNQILKAFKGGGTILGEWPSHICSNNPPFDLPTLTQFWTHSGRADWFFLNMTWPFFFLCLLSIWHLCSSFQCDWCCGYSCDEWFIPSVDQI